MSDFSIKDMLAMQQTLQEKYKDKWETICPEAGKHKLLWMLGEVGEVIDIIKKNGKEAVFPSTDLRDRTFLFEKRRKVNYEEENRIIISHCNANRYPVRSLICS